MLRLSMGPTLVVILMPRILAAGSHRASSAAAALRGVFAPGSSGMHPIRPLIFADRNESRWGMPALRFIPSLGVSDDRLTPTTRENRTNQRPKRQSQVPRETFRVASVRAA